jgi:hypothetical protein
MAGPQLDVSVKPDSVTVIPLVSVSLTVTYTCAGTSSRYTEIAVALEETARRPPRRSPSPAALRT